MNWAETKATEAVRKEVRTEAGLPILEAREHRGPR